MTLALQVVTPGYNTLGFVTTSRIVTKSSYSLRVQLSNVATSRAMLRHRLSNSQRPSQLSIKYYLPDVSVISLHQASSVYLKLQQCRGIEPTICHCHDIKPTVCLMSRRCCDIKSTAYPKSRHQACCLSDVSTLASAYPMSQ